MWNISKRIMNTEGKHILLDIWLKKNIPWRKLKNILASVLIKYKLLILGFQEWEYYPQGNSGVFLIGTSHASVHVYNEHKYITVDIYSCNPSLDDKNIIKDFLGRLPVKFVDTKILSRGRRKKI